MEPKKSKYDTNPLDPDFVKNVGAAPGESGPETQEVSGATREIGSSGTEQSRQHVYSEAPTRRYDNINPESPYQSVFVPPNYSPPTPYQPPPAPYRPIEQKPSHRPVAGLGLPEKWAMMLPYTPFFIGVVPALLILFLVPRNDPRVRFHAAQALALNIAILVIRTLFWGVTLVTGSSIGGTLFGAATLVFLIVSMVRVWKGETHFIAPLAEPAQWLNGKIEPRNKS
ncbi:MAG TPA: DUF4870 domain-containing protein [Pyrinomonadaceae bacterium]|jgi:uncharacterized membrane protein|nr:DUF4870 domain-containing protein [Pyrinomonadaceae bacterium]